MISPFASARPSLTYSVETGLLFRSQRDLIGWNRGFNAANQFKWSNPNSKRSIFEQQLSFLTKNGKLGSKKEILEILRKIKQERRARMLRKLGY